MYGVPEAYGASVEKLDMTQYFKCIECALEGVDNHLTDIYQVNGTTYCLRHAKDARGPLIIRTKDTYVNTPNGPANGFYVQAD